MSTSNNNSSSTTTNGWAPICYPSAAIFASNNSAANEGEGSTTTSNGACHGLRTADPFFPLHRDVLLAAMRELLVIDGRIDARTMKVVVPMEEEEEETCNMSLNERTEKKRARSASAETNEAAGGALPTLSDDDDEEAEAGAPSSLSKKQRMQNSSVDSMVDLQKQLLQKPAASTQPHVVPITEKVSFDYSQFESVDKLVEYVVNRATSSLESASKNDGYAEPTPSSTEERIASKRKVSDVDDIEAQLAKAASFPSCIVSLVRSNIMILQTFSSGAPNSLTKLQNCLPTSLLTDREKNIFHSALSSQMTMAELLPRGTENFEKTNDTIVEFLHRPQLHRQRQQGLQNKSLLVLPQLLEASVTDESYLREFAHNMIVSMIDSIPGNDFEVPLRVFLGYKSTKTPSRERLLDMICGLLFDVSHAMHAWVHTEKDMMRKLQVSKQAMNSKDMDEHIKNALFDHRAIKNIGGFDDSSLLPLALGVHRCRQKKITWTEYAAVAEGKNAFSLHYATADESTKVRNRQNDIVGHAALFETGRKRRGRRGRSIYSSGINA
jgi:hypothetical protein